MNSFQAKRVSRTHAQHLIAPPETVFPLLCPVREYDWIEDWECDLIYTESGVVENNCIFATHFPGEGDEVWVTSLHDPKTFRLEFVRVAAGFKVIKYNIQLFDNGDGSTRAEWTQTVTALSERGNRYVEEFSKEKYRALIERIERMLNHYFREGKAALKQNR